MIFLLVSNHKLSLKMIKNIKMKKILSILLLVLTFTSVNAQEKCLLEQAAVQDLVQDYANILSNSRDAEKLKLLYTAITRSSNKLHLFY